LEVHDILLSGDVTMTHASSIIVLNIPLSSWVEMDFKCWCALFSVEFNTEKRTIDGCW